MYYMYNILILTYIYTVDHLTGNPVLLRIRFNTLDVLSVHAEILHVKYIGNKRGRRERKFSFFGNILFKSF